MFYTWRAPGAHVPLAARASQKAAEAIARVGAARECILELEIAQLRRLSAEAENSVSTCACENTRG